MKEERLKRTQFFVEANDFERLTLWKNFNEKISWEQDLEGFSLEIGKIKKRLIFVKFSFDSYIMSLNRD